MELTEQQKLEILCAYLPHGLIMYGASDMWTLSGLGLYDVTLVNQVKQNLTFDDLITNYSPILRHPDDMTESELQKLADIMDGLDPDMVLLGNNLISLKTAQSALRYLHSIHVDTFGAIEAGWAIRKENN